MKNILFISLFLLVLPCMASPAHWFWPQKDVEEFSVKGSSTGIKVLISSRKSDFKKAVVSVLTDSLKKDSASIKVVGLRDLKEEKQEHYDVVIIINSCMGFGMDTKVKRFLRKQKSRKSIIVLTTSGGGSWSPRKKGMDYDAVSAASERDGVEPAVREIIKKIKNIVEK